MTKPLTALVIGAGDRGNAYGIHAQNAGLDIQIAGVADPIRDKRELMAERYHIPREMVFESGEEALEKRIPVDAVFITTPDKTHCNLAVLALENGYNVLLEKPMATNPRDCADIVTAQKESGKVLSICHVLRYAPFFQTIREIVNSDELGRIQNIDLTEKIAYWHFAHSYVRGNWRREEDASPIILAKSCHDLDIMLWLVGQDVKSVFSKGSLRFFDQKNAPKSSLERCADGCSVSDCLFDARKFYLDVNRTKNEEVRWPYSVISPTDLSEEGRKRAIEQGPYGRCVFKCDNNVCDSQDVLIEFENGVYANFRLRSGGDAMTREIDAYFERGELIGDLRKGEICKKVYSGRKGEDRIEVIDLKKIATGSHGGGDPLLLKGFIDAVKSGNKGCNLTSAEQSLQSHLLAFAAEESRHSGQTVAFGDYKSRLLI